MPRLARVDIGGEVYHIINRANGRSRIFESDAGYRLFEELLADAIEKTNMRLLAYCIMPNHWHLVLQPRKEGNGDSPHFHPHFHPHFPRSLTAKLWDLTKQEKTKERQKEIICKYHLY